MFLEIADHKLQQKSTKNYPRRSSFPCKIAVCRLENSYKINLLTDILWETPQQVNTFNSRILLTYKH